MSRRFGRRNARGGNQTAGAINPASLSPYVHLEADTGVTQVANRISSFISKTNAIDFAQASGPAQILYTAADASFNNLPTFSVDGAARYLEAAVSVPLPFSVFEYGSHTGTGSWTCGLFGAVGEAESNWAAGNMRGYAIEYAGSSALTPTLADADSQKRSMYKGCAASTVITMRRNAGTPVSAANVGLGGSPTHTLARVGWSALALQQTLAVYLIFTRELTSAEQAGIHRWCVAKYGA